MMLPTKQLISKIETLSKDLSPKQLSNFLDIIDAPPKPNENLRAAFQSYQDDSLNVERKD